MNEIFADIRCEDRVITNSHSFQLFDREMTVLEEVIITLVSVYCKIIMMTPCVNKFYDFLSK